MESVDVGFAEIERALMEGLRVGGVQEAALAPIEHVDDDDDVALARHLSGDFTARVVLLAEIGEDRMLVAGREDFLLAPEVEAAVIVKGDNARRWEFGVLRNEDVGGNTEVGSCLKRKVLEGVVSPIGFAD